MEITRYAEAVLFLLTITASGLALGECPKSMPEQLLEDCIVYEGAGDTFPTSDYAYMDQYQNWLKTQQPPGIAQPTTAATPTMK